nr:hypothetical protein [Human alphaherpesvirus 2]
MQPNHPQRGGSIFTRRRSIIESLCLKPGVGVVFGHKLHCERLVAVFRVHRVSRHGAFDLRRRDGGPASCRGGTPRRLRQIRLSRPLA